MEKEKLPIEESKEELLKSNKLKKKGASLKFGMAIIVVLLISGLAFLLMKKGEVRTNEIGLLVIKKGYNDEISIVHGTVFGKPISKLIIFPLNTKTYKQEKLNGSNIIFRSKDGISLKVDTYVEVKLQPNKVVEFYRTHNTDFDSVIENHFSLNIRDEFVYKASTMSADSILNNQEHFITDIESKCKKKAIEGNFNLIKLGYLSPIEIPKELEKVVADVIFSKELTEKARVDRNRVQYELELSEAMNKKILDSVVTTNLIKMHTQMTNNEMRINQFRTDSNVYAVKYNTQILEAMRIDNYTKAIEKWNGVLPNSQSPDLRFPFNNSSDKIAKEISNYDNKYDTISKEK